MTTATAAKSSWFNKFCTPNEDELLSPLQNTELVSMCRSAMLGFEDCRESIEWKGIPWRWCFEHRLKGHDTPLAYVVPSPPTPRLAVPLPATMLVGMPMRKLPRFIREAVVHAPKVNGTVWCEWDLVAKTQTNDLLDLLKMKHQQLCES